MMLKKFFKYWGIILGFIVAFFTILGFCAIGLFYIIGEEYFGTFVMVISIIGIVLSTAFLAWELSRD